MKSITALFATAILALCGGQAAAKLTPFDPPYNAMVLYIRQNLRALGEAVRAQRDHTLIKALDEFMLDTESVLATGEATFTDYAAHLKEFYEASADNHEHLMDDVNQRLADDASDSIVSPTVVSDIVFDMLEEVIEARKDEKLTSFVLHSRLDVEESIHEDFNDVWFDTKMYEFQADLAERDPAAFESFGQIWTRVQQEMVDKYGFTDYASFEGDDELTESSTSTSGSGSGSVYYV